MPAAAKDTKKDTKTATKPAATSTKKAAVQRLAIGLRGLRGHAVTKRQKKVANPHRKNVRRSFYYNWPGSSIIFEIGSLYKKLSNLWILN